MMMKRLHSLFAGLLVLLTAALLACAPVGAKSASRGYQLFGRGQSGHLAVTSSTSLANFDCLAGIAPECRNAPNNPIVPGGDFSHEAAGGHFSTRHIERSDADLGARLASLPNTTAVPSFPDRATAERAVSSALDANAANISQFLNGSGDRLVINHDAGSLVGNVMTRGSTSAPSSNVRVVIQRDATMPTGYRIITGFSVP